MASTELKEADMDQLVNPGRCCPKCESKDYVFRGRKTLAADPAQETPAAVETKYHCRSCGHQWKELVSK